MGWEEAAARGYWQPLKRDVDLGRADQKMRDRDARERVRIFPVPRTG